MDITASSTVSGLSGVGFRAAPIPLPAHMIASRRRHLPSSSHGQKFCSNCVFQSISVLQRSQEVGLCRHPAWIPQVWRVVFVRKSRRQEKNCPKQQKRVKNLGFSRSSEYRNDPILAWEDNCSASVWSADAVDPACRTAVLLKAQ